MTIDELFNTPEKVAQAITTLSEGMATPFWGIMGQILDANINEARRQLEEGTGAEEETPESITRIRDRLRIYKDIRNTPEDMIKKLKSEDVPDLEIDPYVKYEPEVEIKT